jgi:hypothetical protein
MKSKTDRWNSKSIGHWDEPVSPLHPVGFHRLPLDQSLLRLERAFGPLRGNCINHGNVS